MKRVLVLSALLVLVTFPASAARNRIALFDITVHSENSEYKHIGKGFSELISVELRKSQGITIVHRRKILEFLEEMNQTLPELDNLKATVLVSKMLKADYVIWGEIDDACNLSH
jgi:TolB-like protein